jgi:hypothetical protein
MTSLPPPMALLRKILQDPEILIAPGAHNAFTAKIIEQAGFKAVYMTGSGAAMPSVGSTVNRNSGPSGSGSPGAARCPSPHPP